MCRSIEVRLSTQFYLLSVSFLNNDSIDGSIIGICSALMSFYDPVSAQDAPEVGRLFHQRRLPGGEHYMLSDDADPQEHGH